MATTCSQCGAALTERDAFCTKCGARRENASEPVAPRRFCTKCGAPLLGETKFCTKCGAAAGVAAAVPISQATSATASAEKAAGATPGSVAVGGVGSQPAVSSGKSAAGIPKGAIIGGAVVVAVLVLVVAIAGFINAAHRAKQKAAEMQAASDIEKNFKNLGGATNGSAQRANGPSPADVNKSTNDLAAAANALAQNAQKQGGTNPPNAIPGISGAASGSASSPGSAGGSNPAPGSPAAIAAASAAVDAALIPPPLPKPAPIVPVAGTGDPAHDWPLEYERTVGGPEADLVVRTGDINNLSFGWPKGFDPFSGQSTPGHPWPNIDHIPPNAPPGTDRIMLGTGVMPVHMSIQHVPGQADRIAVDVIVKQALRLPSDGYSGSLADCFLVRDFETQLEDPNAPIVIASKEEGQQEMTRYWAPKCTRERELTDPVPVVMSVGALPARVDAVVFQIFVDDFQPRPMHSHFQVSLNGTRIPSFEYAINSLDQSGPIGKLLTLRLLPEYWPLLKSGTVDLLIDDPTTHVPDGYAIDFVRILVNPHNFKYEVSLTTTVTDADTHKPIAGAMVSAGLTSAAADRQGKCELKQLPAGLVVATASAPGYDENSVPVDLPAGQTGNADIQLHRHQESTAALEQSIAQTGSAEIYGIHFDTGSSKLRSDSLPALNAVLGLIDNHAGSRWIISGHTDNQGSDKLNVPLSKARAASVIAWLTAHGVAANRLEPQGFGATRPVADNATANGRFLNRRVEVALAK
ncbi:MAG TPA: OmpA family protein [Candidatus Acidoferrales bacterium]|nr:OmpA family protein [Candidatus Acidoferrales bacterium]HEV2499667.1 OmpA family protein [Terriglobia bacterium]